MERPEHVGILALEVYFPRTMVRQEDMEAEDGCPGKYRQGLGQTSLAFSSDREDVVALGLNALQGLMDKHGVGAQEIGWLQVSSEGGVDRSKSVKSYLMRLLQEGGNDSVEGADVIHACYGGTASLLHAAAWVESSGWDGRFAVVVAADVALYEPGSAGRPTGGCGAVAMLIGPDAPLAMEPGWRATYSAHAEEFCKPLSTGLPYPVLDGQATLYHFLRGVDRCYAGLHRRLQSHRPDVDLSQGLLPHVDYLAFHAPFNKMVRKAFARLAMHDYIRRPLQQQEGPAPLASWPALAAQPEDPPAASYSDRELERRLLDLSSSEYDAKVSPSTWAQVEVGNSYTASLAFGLAALLEGGAAGGHHLQQSQQTSGSCNGEAPSISCSSTNADASCSGSTSGGGALRAGQRVLCFAFGSGVMASLYALRGREPATLRFSLASMQAKLQLRSRLQARQACPPAAYLEATLQHEKAHHTAPYSPQGSLDLLWPGSWYLDQVDAQYKRTYKRSSPGAQA